VIEALPENDRAGLAEYVERRGDWLGRCAYLLTRDRELALDLVQETLLLAWRSRDLVAAAEDSERYVLRIMLNRHRAQHRGSRLRLVSLEQHAVPAEAGVDPIALVDDTQALMGALAVLTSRQRAVVVLRYWADYDDQQIADVLGCKRATVRSLAARSMHKLKRHLERR
jgi:RNA polymerase sigma factor (sigma-70 family)